MNQKTVILFDGICNLCCWWVQFLIKRDKRMKFLFASLQSKSAESLLNSADLSGHDFKSIVYLKEGQFLFESTAVLQILSDIGGIWKAFVIFRLIPKAIRNKLYRFIARKRYKLFGKRSSCMLPTLENQKRFLT